jgi:hypothetical protein
MVSDGQCDGQYQQDHITPGQAPSTDHTDHTDHQNALSENETGAGPAAGRRSASVRPPWPRTPARHEGISEERGLRP